MIRSGDKAAAPASPVGPGDVTFEPASAVDPFGRVFRHQGKVYRTVAEPFTALAGEILARAPEWAAHGLVGTTRADFAVEGSPLVLAHDPVRFISYCTEWPPQMLKDAALAYLRLQLRLMEDGYVLKDGHPWNVLFERGAPVYVDVGSIDRFAEPVLQGALDNFRLYFLLPLRLFARWGSGRTFTFLNRPIPNPSERTALAAETRVRRPRITRLSGPDRVVKRLLRKVERMDVSNVDRTEWTAYPQQAPPVEDPDRFVDKQRVPYEVLKRIGGGTVLDIGCNKGWYSLLAESMGFDVVATDVDVASLGILYERVKRERRRILPLRVDICAPTPPNGMNDAYPGFMDRMACDVVLAMAVVHHLAYKRRLPFETFAERLAALARKAAVVEFIPADDEHVARWDQTGMEGYTAERFVGAFLRHFAKVTELPSTPAPRKVYVFEK